MWVCKQTLKTQMQGNWVYSRQGDWGFPPIFGRSPLILRKRDRKQETILSAKKREKFLSNLAKKRLEHSKPQQKRPFLFMPNRQNSDVSVQYWLKTVPK